MTLIQKLLDDEHGFIITTELVIIATLLVIGLITGIQCLRAAVVSELQDVGAAIGSLNQSYAFTGKHGCRSWRCGRISCTAGSAFFDEVDEYRENYEIGQIEVAPETVTPQQPSVPAPAPTQVHPSERIIIQEAPAVVPAPSVPVPECPPDAIILPESMSDLPMAAPDACPPTEACPPDTLIVPDGPTLAPGDCPQVEECLECPQEQLIGPEVPLIPSGHN